MPTIEDFQIRNLDRNKENMKYQDRIYREIEIKEPVILELINSSTLQRLKKVDQIGYFEPYFPGTSHSRFEHSLGVFILLKKFGASLEEQIAGLIHDVSHSAFSHCIDYVLAEGSQKEHNHQDNVFEEFVRKSEMPAILNKYNINLDYILDDNNFPFKERNLPDLCADRIDYSLRTAAIFKEVDKADINYFLNNLTAENSYWIFKNFESAKKYAELFLKLNSKYYAGIESAVMFATVGNYLRYALDKKYISKDDLYATDKEVLDKINAHLNEDSRLELLFDRMNNQTGFKENSQDYDSHIFCKSRVVDPLFKDANEIKRVSEIDSDWKVILEKESKPKEYFIKFNK